MEMKVSQRRMSGLRAVAVAATLAALLLVLAASAHVAAASGATLLPNLVADPPDTQSIATDTSTGTPRLLLRFNGYIHNKGPGAVDFRGSREAPKVSEKVTEEVEKAREKEEPLSQKVEEELAVPPMKTFQRLFTTSAEETNIERAHVDESSSGELDLLERRRPPPLAPAEDRALLAVERRQDGRSGARPEGRVLPR